MIHLTHTACHDLRHEEAEGDQARTGRCLEEVEAFQPTGDGKHVTM